VITRSLKSEREGTEFRALTGPYSLDQTKYITKDQWMEQDLITTKTDHELLETLLKETAKASNELNTVKQDLHKAQNRVKFSIMLINRLLERTDQ